MVDVVQFPAKEPVEELTGSDYCWFCRFCNCRSFVVRFDHVLECANCEAVQTLDAGEWVRILPEPKRDARSDVGTTKVIRLRDTQAAMQSAIEALDKESLICLIGVHITGRVKTWRGTLNNAEEHEWLKARLLEEVEKLTSQDVNDCKVRKSERDGKIAD